MPKDLWIPKIVLVKWLTGSSVRSFNDKVSLRWVRDRKKLYVFNNILYNENRIVVPTQMIKTVLFQHHDSVFAGHRGAESILESFKTRFYCNFMQANQSSRDGHGKLRIYAYFFIKKTCTCFKYHSLTFNLKLEKNWIAKIF